MSPSSEPVVCNYDYLEQCVFVAGYDYDYARCILSVGYSDAGFLEPLLAPSGYVTWVTILPHIAERKQTNRPQLALRLQALFKTVSSIQ